MTSRWSSVRNVLVLGLLGTTKLVAGEMHDEKYDFFEKRIRPLLVSRCYACHSAETKPAGGLRVDDHSGILAGGNTGAGIVPGDINSSGILGRLTSQDANRRMPRDSDPLTSEQIDDFKKWIADGANWPPLKDQGALGESEVWYQELRETHWAWQPITRPKVPQIQGDSWSNSDIDRFVYEQLNEYQLTPVSDASKGDWLRRVTFDLIGLPPTQKDLRDFQDDDTSDAYARVVDRLLASKHFGEHWGRHWLDLARYGESTGPSRNIPYPHAWRYRDYVIESLNQDVPYDRFIQEQVAGDLLPSSNSQERNRLQTATGFLALGVKDVNQRFKVRFDMDNVDEQIDVVSKAVLGLTVSCARCHDHKFDPIPTADYYALAGIFTSTVNASGLRNQMGGSGLAYYVPTNLVSLNLSLPTPPDSEVKALEAKVAEAKAAWDAIRGTPEGLKPLPNGQLTQRKFRIAYEEAQAELNGLIDPAERGAAIHGLRDAVTTSDTAIRLRGEAEKLGPIVPRGFLTAFEVPETKPVNPEQSGRLELAYWLTSSQNPLTSRVAVNRIWYQMFGSGLVSTVDNFGLNGAQPTHPKLLDYLASEFVQDDWSVKRLIKRLALSRTYRLSANATSQHLANDPSNSLYWRHSPRRLTAEEVRDAMLATASRLELVSAEVTPVQKLKMRELRDNGPEAAQIQKFSEESRARSVYLPLLRGVVPRSLAVFDPVEQTLVTGAETPQRSHRRRCS